jgi:toxin FitB
MNVVDSSGWVEYFCKGPKAGIFAAPIQDAQNLVVPTICIYEVFKKVLLQFGEETALTAAAAMLGGKVVDLDRDLAIDAALISAEKKLAMADSIILAAAHAFDATLWTKDEHFKELPGVQYIEN